MKSESKAEIKQAEIAQFPFPLLMTINEPPGINLKGSYTVLFNDISKGVVINTSNDCEFEVGYYSESWDIERFHYTDNVFLLSN